MRVENALLGFGIWIGGSEMTHGERLEAMIKIDEEWVPEGENAAMMKECIVNNLLNMHCPGDFFAGAPRYGISKVNLTCSECWNTEEPEAEIAK